mgnify:CR=1 FL=1
MNQQDFERHNEAYWQETEALIDNLSKNKQMESSVAAEFPQRYRQVCQHLALARERVDLLVDPGTAFLELSPLAAHGLYGGDVHSASVITGASAGLTLA